MRCRAMTTICCNDWKRRCAWRRRSTLRAFAMEKETCTNAALLFAAAHVPCAFQRGGDSGYAAAAVALCYAICREMDPSDDSPWPGASLACRANCTACAGIVADVDLRGAAVRS